MKIAVIGSRETEMVYNRLLFGLVNYWLTVYEHEVRSGLCKKGPDDVVTRTCVLLDKEMGLSGRRPNVRLYPPEPKSWILPEYQFMASDEVFAEQKKIVEKLHPNPTALDDYMWKLHCRNLSIISDIDMCNPVDLVVYAHPKVKVSGGTKIGVDYARSLDIETINVVHTPLVYLVGKIEKG